MPEQNILVADVGGTHIGVAIFTHDNGRFEPVRHETYRSHKIRDLPGLFRKFLKSSKRLPGPPVTSACIDVAGPVTSGRSEALITNLGWRVKAADILEAIKVKELTLLNDFEAVGYGLEVLLRNH